MKKTKRTARSRSVRHHRKTEAMGTTGLVWTLIVLVLAGAIGWYAFKQTGGTSGAQAGTAGTLSNVTIDSNNSSLTVGSQTNFSARAWSGNQQMNQKVSYIWTVVPGTAGATLTQNDSWASVTPKVIKGGAPDGTGYLTVLVTASSGGITRIANQTLTVYPSRSISRVAINPIVSYLAVGQEKTLLAQVFDTRGQVINTRDSANVDLVTYDWTLINNTAEGKITNASISVSDNSRTARGEKVSIGSVRAGSSGGYFSIILTATYNGQKRSTGTFVWTEPAPILSKVVIDPKMANTVSGRSVVFYATSTDATGKRVKADYTWKGVGVSGAKFEQITASNDNKGFGAVRVKVTLPAGSSGALIPVTVTAKQGDITKTDTAVLTVRP